MKPQRIALFGGTFDPVHRGHIHIAEAAVTALSLDHVVFIPCRQSPHKETATIADEQDRIAMLQLATADLQWAEISEIESFFVVLSQPENQITPTVELYHQCHLRGILLKGITG